MKTLFDKDRLEYCQVGKCYIWGDNPDMPTEVHHGRVFKYGYKQCEEYLSKRPKLLEAYNQWLWHKSNVVKKWKHETPHKRYDCDAGSLAVRINGTVIVKIGNGVGDGNFPVYILPPKTYSPPTFKLTDTWITGPCVVDVLDYDCSNANVLDTIDLKDECSLLIYRDSRGAFVLQASSIKD